ETDRQPGVRRWKAERGGRGSGARDDGYLGVQCDGNTCKITAVTPGSPAEKAGLQVGDVIVRFDENDVKNWNDLGDRIFGKKAGQEVAIEVRRGSEEVTLRVKIGRRTV